MNWNLLLFVVFPYISIILAVVVTVYRTIYLPFSVSSLSSQLLERKKLYWGVIPFHYGILIILLGHLLALVFPQGLKIWNSVPVRLYLLEFSALALGLWMLVGLGILVWRRFSNARIQTVTTKMDVVVFVLLLLSGITGVITATVYRYGSAWFTAIFTPYLWSLLILQPKPELIAPLPWVISLHALNFFILLAVLPFSRLVHIITYPFRYWRRPWQTVIWERRRRKAAVEDFPAYRER
ncbi:MAG: respiratory nitrate reductase subunit gamma [Omnitrophica WOR_2 bacterium]